MVYLLGKVLYLNILFVFSSWFILLIDLIVDKFDIVMGGIIEIFGRRK